MGWQVGVRLPAWRLGMVLACLVAVPVGAGAQANWHQVNEDGFGLPASASSQLGTELVAFGDVLLAYCDSGVYQLKDPLCAVWKKIAPPASTGFVRLGSCLFGVGPSGGLYWIALGSDPDISVNWHPVTSIGLPAGAAPSPMALFNGNVYGVTRFYNSPTGGWAFEIWRSPNLGQNVMTWTKVVDNSFGDPENNRDVNFIGVYNGRIYVGTESLRGVFGDTAQYVGGGVEIWESPSGDPGTWTQVNTDGFGTEVLQPISGLTLRTNQIIGCWVVYNGWLYIGTKSHLGAEVWRYNGTGKSGWQNVTPPSAGPDPVFSTPGRNNAMAVYQNSLYLAEGFPSGNLLRYDGNHWSVEVAGPSPFDPTNIGLTALAVVGTDLYVSTKKSIGLGATQGDEVWGYPFPPFVATAIACQGPKTLLWWPEIPKGIIEKVQPAWIPNISGAWHSLFGIDYQVTQTGAGFTWYAAAIHETGTGTITGNQVSASWNGDLGSGSATGTITVGPDNVATLIQWSNGSTFFR
ncbi:MAG: hypothetical protein PHW86_01060 [Candidatus Bipolaricaulis sp.]|nr:hypothetical protein [Candidatus Bipolaricaulis sp.]